MILSRTAEYALRIMAAISIKQGAIPMRASEISEQISCPKHYVSKVLRKLVSAGLLKAEKGHGGGFVLSKRAGQIMFCDIMDAVDSPTKQKHCIFGWRQCNSKQPCILHNRWNTVSSAFNDWSRTTSLEDIQKDAKSSNWLLASDNSLLKQKK